MKSWIPDPGSRNRLLPRQGVSGRAVRPVQLLTHCLSLAGSKHGEEREGGSSRTSDANWERRSCAELGECLLFWFQPRTLKKWRTVLFYSKTVLGKQRKLESRGGKRNHHLQTTILKILVCFPQSSLFISSSSLIVIALYIYTFYISFSSVTQLCLTLWDPMDCSTPGLPVHRQLPEVAQTHVHWLGDAIQPPYPLSSPSPLAFNLSQHQSLFQWVSLKKL